LQALKGKAQTVDDPAVFASEAQPASGEVEKSRLREQARVRQRRYRQSNRRIDYHPDAWAIEVINALRTRSVGGDASSIINRIVCLSTTLNCSTRSVGTRSTVR